jgi:hypothetical protein
MTAARKRSAGEDRLSAVLLPPILVVPLVLPGLLTRQPESVRDGDLLDTLLVPSGLDAQAERCAGLIDGVSRVVLRLLKAPAGFEDGAHRVGHLSMLAQRLIRPLCHKAMLRMGLCQLYGWPVTENRTAN